MPDFLEELSPAHKDSKKAIPQREGSDFGRRQGLTPERSLDAVRKVLAGASSDELIGREIRTLLREDYVRILPTWLEYHVEGQNRGILESLNETLAQLNQSATKLLGEDPLDSRWIAEKIVGFVNVSQAILGKWPATLAHVATEDLGRDIIDALSYMTTALTEATGGLSYISEISEITRDSLSDMLAEQVTDVYMQERSGATPTEAQRDERDRVLAECREMISANSEWRIGVDRNFATFIGESNKRLRTVLLAMENYSFSAAKNLDALGSRLARRDLNGEREFFGEALGALQYGGRLIGTIKRSISWAIDNIHRPGSNANNFPKVSVAFNKIAQAAVGVAPALRKSVQNVGGRIRRAERKISYTTNVLASHAKIVASRTRKSVSRKMFAEDTKKRTILENFAASALGSAGTRREVARQAAKNSAVNVALNTADLYFLAIALDLQDAALKLSLAARGVKDSLVGRESKHQSQIPPGAADRESSGRNAGGISNEARKTVIEGIFRSILDQRRQGATNETKAALKRARNSAYEVVAEVSAKITGDELEVQLKEGLDLVPGEHFDDAREKFADLRTYLESAITRLRQAADGLSQAAELSNQDDTLGKASEKAALAHGKAGEAKAEIKLGITMVTGAPLHNFSREGLLANAVAEWVDEKERKFSEQFPDLNLEIIRRASGMLIEENIKRDFSLKVRDPHATVFIRRVHLALERARKKRTIWPLSPAQFVDTQSKSVTDYLNAWGEKRVSYSLMFALSTLATGRPHAAFGILMSTGVRSLLGMSLKLLFSIWRAINVPLNVQKIRALTRPGESVDEGLIDEYLVREISRGAIKLATLPVPRVALNVAAVALTVNGLATNDEYRKRFLKRAKNRTVVDVPFASGISMTSGAYQLLKHIQNFNDAKLRDFNRAITKGAGADAELTPYDRKQAQAWLENQRWYVDESQPTTGKGLGRKKRSPRPAAGEQSADADVLAYDYLNKSVLAKLKELGYGNLSPDTQIELTVDGWTPFVVATEIHRTVRISVSDLVGGKWRELWKSQMTWWRQKFTSIAPHFLDVRSIKVLPRVSVTKTDGSVVEVPMGTTLTLPNATVSTVDGVKVYVKGHSQEPVPGSDSSGKNAGQPHESGSKNSRIQILSPTGTWETVDSLDLEDGTTISYEPERVIPFNTALENTELAEQYKKKIEGEFAENLSARQTAAQDAARSALISALLDPSIAPRLSKEDYEKIERLANGSVESGINVLSLQNNKVLFEAEWTEMHHIFTVTLSSGDELFVSTLRDQKAWIVPVKSTLNYLDRLVTPKPYDAVYKNPEWKKWIYRHMSLPGKLINANFVSDASEELFFSTVSRPVKGLEELSKELVESERLQHDYAIDTLTSSAYATWLSGLTTLGNDATEFAASTVVGASTGKLLGSIGNGVFGAVASKTGANAEKIGRAVGDVLTDAAWAAGSNAISAGNATSKEEREKIKESLPAEVLTSVGMGMVLRPIAKGSATRPLATLNSRTNFIDTAGRPGNATPGNDVRSPSVAERSHINENPPRGAGATSSSGIGPLSQRPELAVLPKSRLPTRRQMLDRRDGLADRRFANYTHERKVERLHALILSSETYGKLYAQSPRVAEKWLRRQLKWYESSIRRWRPLSEELKRLQSKARKRLSRLERGRKSQVAQTDSLSADAATILDQEITFKTGNGSLVNTTVRDAVSRSVNDPSMVLNPLAKLLQRSGYTDIRYRGIAMGFRLNGYDDYHFALIGRKGGTDYVFDLWAGQYENRGIPNFRTPLIMTQNDWLESYKQSLTRRNFTFQDYKTSAAAFKNFAVDADYKAKNRFLHDHSITTSHVVNKGKEFETRVYTTDLGKSILHTDGVAKGRTLVITAHGDYSTENVVRIPQGTTVDFLNPHTTYLKNPNLEKMVNGSPLAIASMQKNGVKVNTLEAQQAISEKKSQKPISGSHQLGTVRDYNLYHYEDDTLDVVANVIGSNRRLAALRDVKPEVPAPKDPDTVDVLTIKQGGSATLKEIFEELAAKGIHYDRIVFGACRGKQFSFNRSFDPTMATPLPPAGPVGRQTTAASTLGSSGAGLRAPVFPKSGSSTQKPSDVLDLHQQPKPPDDGTASSATTSAQDGTALHQAHSVREILPGNQMAGNSPTRLNEDEGPFAAAFTGEPIPQQGGQNNSKFATEAKNYSPVSGNFPDLTPTARESRHLQLGNELGRGQSGVVYNDASDTRYVIKELPRAADAPPPQQYQPLPITQRHLSNSIKTAEREAEAFNKYYGSPKAEVFFSRFTGNVYIRMPKVPGVSLNASETFNFPPDATERFDAMFARLTEKGIVMQDINVGNIIWDAKTQTFYPIDIQDVAAKLDTLSDVQKKIWDSGRRMGRHQVRKFIEENTLITRAPPNKLTIDEIKKMEGYPTSENHPKLSKAELETKQKEFENEKRMQDLRFRSSGEPVVLRTTPYSKDSLMRFNITKEFEQAGVKYQSGYIDLPKDINRPVSVDNPAIMRLHTVNEISKFPVDSVGSAAVVSAHGEHVFSSKPGARTKAPNLTKVPPSETVELAAPYGMSVADPRLPDYVAKHNEVNLFLGINVVDAQGNIKPFELRPKKGAASNDAPHRYETDSGNPVTISEAPKDVEKKRLSHTGVGDIDSSGNVQIHDLSLSHFEPDDSRKVARAVEGSIIKGTAPVQAITVLPGANDVKLSDVQNVMRQLNTLRNVPNRTHLKVLACRPLTPLDGPRDVKSADLPRNAKASLARRFNIKESELLRLLDNTESQGYKAVFSYRVIEHKGEPSRPKRDIHYDEERTYEVEFEQVVASYDVDLETGDIEEVVVGYLLGSSDHGLAVVSADFFSKG